ncbi:hypothetical protein, partial [Timonella senegalensis]|uniref:hypothetical protein n=1 Tax=Timonella senegalensis TaxID=1465825 RepID=UPI002FE1029C
SVKRSKQFFDTVRVRVASFEHASPDVVLDMGGYVWSYRVKNPLLESELKMAARPNYKHPAEISLYRIIVSVKIINTCA